MDLSLRRGALGSVALTLAVFAVRSGNLYAADPPTYNVFQAGSIAGFSADGMNSSGVIVGHAVTNFTPNAEGFVNSIAYAYLNGAFVNLMPALGNPDSAIPAGINSNGDIAFTVTKGTATHAEVAFVSGASVNVLRVIAPPVGFTNTVATGINSSRVVSGAATAANQASPKAYLFDASQSTVTATPIGTTLSGDTSAVAISDVQSGGSGQAIIANTFTDGTPNKLYTYQLDTAHEVDAQIRTATGAVGDVGVQGKINSSGNFVGVGIGPDPADNAVGFSANLTTRQVTALPSGFLVSDNNSGGAIVGSGGESFGDNANPNGIFAAVYQNGALTDLNTLVKPNTFPKFFTADSISDDGQIVVRPATGNNIYLLRPVNAAADNNTVPAGSGVTAGVNGGAAVAGGTTITFGNVSSESALTVHYDHNDAQSLASLGGPITFATAPTKDGSIIDWYVSFDGGFTGGAQAVFHFDPSDFAPGTNLSNLLLYHFENGQWVVPPGETVDVVNDTFTVNVNSFSPFAIGTAVPEPASAALLVVPAIGLLWRRRRTKGK